MAEVKEKGVSFPFEKLPLESALNESPQIASLCNVYGEDAKVFGDYLAVLLQLSQQLVATHNKLTSTYQDIAKHLKNYTPSKYVPNSDSGGTLAYSLSTFSEVVSEMSSWQHILATQVADGVVYPLSRFVDAELQEIRTLESLYHTCGGQVERAIGRYSRCKRKDSPQEKHEAVEEVYKTRKKYHQFTLQYYSRLNQLQLGRQLALLKPVMGLVSAAKGFHQLGQDSFAASNNNDFLSSIGVNLKSLEQELHKEKEDTHELSQSIRSQCELVYYPEPPGELARVSPDTTLTTKSGYLNVHRKYMGVMSLWEYQFVFLEGGNLMSMSKGEVAGSLLLELDVTTLAHATDTDDRMHVFSVSSAKKCVILQALNDRDRDEWMITIERVAKEGGYVKTQQNTQATSLFAGFGQYFAEKFQAAVGGGGGGGGGGLSSSPQHQSPSSIMPANAPRGLRGDVIPQDAPISFDILSSQDDQNSAHAWPNENESNGDGAGSEELFSVRFLGSMGVNVDTVESFLVGQTVVFEVMRRILAARAIHNVFSTTSFHLVVHPSHIALKEPSTGLAKLTHKLPDVAFWASHVENSRLMGYIVRQTECEGKSHTFSCYVFECDDEGKAICGALGRAARHAYAHLLDTHTQKVKIHEETKLLLANIALLPDKDSPLPLSEDGGNVLLDAESPTEGGTRGSPLKKSDSEA